MRIALAILAASALPAQVPPELARRLDEAERRIVRLRPAAFPELPGNIAAELARRGCTIPQPSHATKRENAILGQFTKPGQVDWAVLCSSGGSSAILVFWNGSEKHPAEIARQPDRNFLQSDAGDTLIYSRGIHAVGRDYIMSHHKAFGGPVPPPLDHEGIDDAFLGKASVTRYFFEGKWLELTGAD